MILRQKRDSEAFVREKDIDSMKANQYLINNDIVLIASGDEAYSFYTILETSEDINKISLDNGLFAVLIPDNKRYTKEEINELFPSKNTNIIVGNGLTGGGNLQNDININLNPLTREEIRELLKKYIKVEEV